MDKLVQIQFLNIEENNSYTKIIKKVIKKCFMIENLTNTKLYVSVILTTPEQIKV